MHLSYERYRELGGTVEETAYAGYESEAELLLDNWTLNRLHSENVMADLKAQGLQGSVEFAMKAVIDRIDGIREARKSLAAGTVVTSFNNGVNSFGFGGSSGTSTVTMAEYECMERVMELLPVDLTSACVSFNGAM